MILVKQLSLHEYVVKAAIKSSDHKGFELCLRDRLEDNPSLVIFLISACFKLYSIKLSY